MKSEPRSSAWYSWSRSRGTITLNAQLRVVRVGVPLFGRDGALELDPQIAVAAALVHAEVERVILFLVDQRVALRVGPEDVFLHADRKERHRILFDVQDGLAVVGPGEVRLDVLDFVLDVRAGFEVLELQPVLRGGRRCRGRRRGSARRA